MKILQEISSQQPRRSFLPEHNHSGILILDFWLLELWWIWFLLFISHLISGTLLKQPDLTEIIVHIYMCTIISVKSGCFNKVPLIKWLMNNRNHIHHSSRSQKSKIRMPEWLCSGKKLLLGCWLLISCSIFMWQRAQRRSEPSHDLYRKKYISHSVMSDSLQPHEL